ncbi:protein of unknown function [Bradyrhizobium vignae]|uniref:Uncharacterized protein n=1 Tax=Bradyrhizobium vignae TaxID=1549949 RepID=A0A2U3PQ76_9BRAD|nr:protein of unknown function [Bradyrhizobium vignae]
MVSELRRPKPNPDVANFVAGQTGDDLYVTEVTFAEIVYGIEQLSDPPGERIFDRGWITRFGRCSRGGFSASRRT